MIITPASLKALMVGFSKSFQKGLESAESQFDKVATTIPGTGKSTTYGWLGKFPKFREWIGSRQYKNMQAHSYSIVNKKFESSIEVDRDEIEDDEIGVYAPLFETMGQSAKEFPDEYIFGLLKQGFTETCYDGQNFFDTDHPVYAEVDGTGAASTISNMAAGTGPGWYLLDTTRPIKPLIWQTRRKMAFTSKTNATQSDEVFDTDKYKYGADCRANAGFGFWQMAFGSKAALNVANLRAAQQKMEAFKSDGDTPLKIRPVLLVVPTSLRQDAEDILDKALINGGDSNPMYKKFELLVCPWL